jgi:hypothetical protein
MGIEYRHYIVPKPRACQPTAEALSSFLEALIDRRLLPRARGASFEATLNTPSALSLVVPCPVSASWLKPLMSADFVLQWPVENPSALRVTYPFVELPCEESECSFDLEIHFGVDYVYGQGPTVGPLRRFPFRRPRCVCGGPIEYSSEVPYVLEGPRLKSVCPLCGAEFHPERYSSRVQDGWTGATRSVQGGLAYRFAVAFELGKALPSKEGTGLVLRDSFTRAWSDCFAKPFDEIGFLH